MERAELESLARYIRQTADSLWSATLIHPGPKYQDLRRDMEVLTPGGLVAEVSTLGIKPAINAVGYLIKKTEEPVDFGPGADPWDEVAEGRPHPTEPIWYIKTLDGREMRWHNARFIRVPRPQFP